MVKAVKEKQKENAVEYLITVLKAISETVSKNTEVLDDISKRIAEVNKPKQNTQEDSNGDFLNNLIKQQKDSNKAIKDKTKAIQKAIDRKTMSIDDVEAIISDTIEDNTEKLKQFIIKANEDEKINIPVREPEKKPKATSVLTTNSALNEIQLQMTSLKSILTSKTDKGKANPDAPELAINYSIPFAKEMIKMYADSVDKTFLKDNMNLMYQNLTNLSKTIANNQEVSKADIEMVQGLMHDLSKLDYERHFKSLDETVKYLIDNIKDGETASEDTNKVLESLIKYINTNKDIMETNTNRELVDFVKMDLADLYKKVSDKGIFTNTDIDNLNNILVNSAEARAKAEQEIREEYGIEELDEDILETAKDIKNILLTKEKDKAKASDKDNKVKSDGGKGMADSFASRVDSTKDLALLMPHFTKVFKVLMTIMKTPLGLGLLSAVITGTLLKMGIDGILNQESDKRNMEKTNKLFAELNRQRKMQVALDREKTDKTKMTGEGEDKMRKKLMEGTDLTKQDTDLAMAIFKAEKEKGVSAKNKDDLFYKSVLANLGLEDTTEQRNKLMIDMASKTKELSKARTIFDSNFSEFGANEAVAWLKEKNPKAKPHIALRNFNPGNLRDINSPTGYRKFDSMEDGLKALERDIMVKMTGKSAIKPKGKDKIETLEDMIRIYAPSNENDTEAYIKHMENELKVKKDEKVSNLVPRIDEVVRAIVKKESGQAHDYIYLNKVPKIKKDDTKQVKPEEKPKPDSKKVASNTNAVANNLSVTPINQSQTTVNITTHPTKLRDEAMGILLG